MVKKLFIVPASILIIAGILLIGISPSPASAEAMRLGPAFSPANLLVYPYIGNTTGSSAAISWATDTFGSGEVLFSPDQGYANSLPANSVLVDGRYWFSATLIGLDASTTYYYRILLDGTDLTPWTEATFTTAPAAEASSFSFAVVGDNQPGSSSAAPYQMALDVAAMMNQQPELNFVLHTGDTIYDGSGCTGSTSAWSQYVRNHFNVYQAMLGRMPFFTAIGNHEVQTGGCGYPAYTGVFNLPENAPAAATEQYYSFDWGNAHFIVLDTNQYFGSTSAEYKWLVSDLQTTTQPWIFVSEHVPAYSSGDSGSDSAVDRYLVPLFETYGVDVVFNGHDHDYERTCPIRSGACTTTQAGGVVYFTNGGGGAYTSNVGSSWFTALSIRKYEFLKVTLNDCRLQFTGIDRYGAIFDTYSIDRCGPVDPTATSTPTQTPTSTSTTDPNITPSATPEISAGPFRFISWSDGQSESYNVSNTAGQANALNPAFTIFNGDLEDSGVDQAEMDSMNAALGNLGARTFLVRGNHDDHIANSAGLWEDYYTALNKPLPAGVTNYVEMDPNLTYLSYSFDYGNSRLIGLDVVDEAETLTGAQLAFLDGRLADAEARGLTHAFIYFHSPEYCVESTHCGCSAKNDGSCTPAGLVSIINNHPIVSATFHGHEHILGWAHMDSARVAGLTGSYEEFLTSPAGGWTYNEYVYPSRMDYYYPDMSSSQGFAAIDVDGPTFTVSFYKVGVTNPVWSRSFTKGEPTPTGTPTNTPANTTTSTSTPTRTLTSTRTYTLTGTFTGTSTRTPTTTPTHTLTNLPTATFTPTFTATQTFTGTATVTLTLTPTYTLTALPTATFIPTATYTPTDLPTDPFTPTFTVTHTSTWTATGTFTPTVTYTPTDLPAATFTPTFTASQTSTWTATETTTPTLTLPPTATGTATASPSPTLSPSGTFSSTTTFTRTPTATRTATLTRTRTRTPTITRTRTSTLTRRPTRTPVPTRTRRR